MPVIECTCGMIMSLSAADPRRNCIRCGGLEFRTIEKWGLTQRRTGHFGIESTTACCAQSTTLDLAAMGWVVVAPINVGAHI